MKLFYSRGGPRNDLAFEREILETGEIEQPLLFIYEWGSPCLVIGYAQPLDGIDTRAIEDNKVVLLRRMSGGTGVLSTDSLSVSLFVRNHAGYQNSIKGFYSLYLRAVETALFRCGAETSRSRKEEKNDSPVCFFSEGSETLLIHGRKFFGGAQVRKKDTLMVHGTMLFEADYALHEAVFGIDRAEFESRITSIDLDRRKIKAELVSSFSNALDSDAEKPLPAQPSDAYLKELSLQKWSPLGVM